MKMHKIYSRLFRKTGVTGPTLQLLNEDAAYEARVIEWDHKTERLLQVCITHDELGGKDVTLKFTPSEARRIGEVLMGFAKAFERFDDGRAAGYRECYNIANKVFEKD